MAISLVEIWDKFMWPDCPDFATYKKLILRGKQKFQLQLWSHSTVLIFQQNCCCQTAVSSLDERLRENSYLKFRRAVDRHEQFADANVVLVQEPGRVAVGALHLLDDELLGLSLGQLFPAILVIQKPVTIGRNLQITSRIVKVRYYFDHDFISDPCDSLAFGLVERGKSLSIRN